MIYKIIRFGLFFVWLSVALLSASVKEEFDNKIATDPNGHGVNLIFAKAEVEKAFGQESFWGRTDQKESTFLHQALLIADKNVRAVVVDKILKVTDLDLEELLKFKDAQGKTPLFLAVENDDQVSVEEFLKKEKKINAKKGTFDLALNIIAIADNNGVNALDAAENNNVLLASFEKHIKDQNDKYASFIGSDMLYKIAHFKAALAPKKIEVVNDEEEGVGDEKDATSDSDRSEKVRESATKETVEKEKPTEHKKDTPSVKPVQAPLVNEIQTENGGEVPKDGAHDLTPADSVGQDESGVMPGDPIKESVKGSDSHESSIIKPVMITTAVIVLCSGLYTAYEWYDDYVELSEKNKELAEPLPDAEVRALAWKKTKKRFFDFFK